MRVRHVRHRSPAGAVGALTGGERDRELQPGAASAAPPACATASAASPRQPGRRAANPGEDSGFGALIAGLGRYLRWLNGDTAYATWVEHLRRAHPHAKIPSRAEFYRAETVRRWGEVRRCC